MKTILITGSTDGIGFQTAKRLVKEGHNVLIHGRNPQKVKDVKKILEVNLNGGLLDSFVADLSNLSEVKALANAVKQTYCKLDVLINNAGVYNVPRTLTKDGLDVIFAVNTVAPYLLVKELLELFDSSSRIVNLSSAAQAPVDTNTFVGKNALNSGEAYAQSKLAITMWSFDLAKSLENAPIIVAVNPKSFLGSKMVKEAYGIDGTDLSVGADILCRAALSNEFEDANGKYFDNDIGQFANPHPDAMNANKCKEVVKTIENIIAKA